MSAYNGSIFGAGVVEWSPTNASGINNLVASESNVVASPKGEAISDCISKVTFGQVVAYIYGLG
uniref:Uncharacterized protein n=1 Tax=Hyaloperonospora arabidopsidis (strain Emoy2) TaxID=559515 RepID=M4BVE6_HYAAE